MNYFSFSGICSLDIGLRVDGKSVYGGPERMMTPVSVPGRNGDLYIDDGKYSNIDISYSVSVVRNIPDGMTKLKSWLYAQKGYCELKDTYDPQYTRRAIYIGPMDAEHILDKLAHTELTFSCHPMRFSVDGTKTINLTAAGNIYNQEAFPSQPYIKIYGSGNGGIFMNGKGISIMGIDEYVEIDCETMNAYKGTVNKNSTITLSEFPRLKPGANSISWTGGVTKIDIIPRWCTL